ncbi:MAG: bL28 family ribosomal protein [Candidatus Hodgkinia cicadicola]
MASLLTVDLIKLRSKPLFGASVSHSNKKVKRKFKANFKKTKVWSLVLNRFIGLKSSVNFTRKMRRYGSVDFYALNSKRMPKQFLKLKQEISEMLTAVD